MKHERAQESLFVVHIAFLFCPFHIIYQCDLTDTWALQQNISIRNALYRKQTWVKAWHSTNYLKSCSIRLVLRHASRVMKSEYALDSITLYLFALEEEQITFSTRCVLISTLQERDAVVSKVYTLVLTIGYVIICHRSICTTEIDTNCGISKYIV